MGAQEDDFPDPDSDSESPAGFAPTDRLLAARETLLRIATPRLGPPDAATRGAIESIDDPALLDDLALRALSASDWRELIAQA